MKANGGVAAMGSKRQQAHIFQICINMLVYYVYYCVTHTRKHQMFLPAVEDNPVRTFNRSYLRGISCPCVTLFTTQSEYTIDNRLLTSMHPFTYFFARCCHFTLHFCHFLKPTNLLMNFILVAFILDCLNGTLHHVFTDLAEDLFVGGATSLFCHQRVR